jgi:hypothetical protein
VSRAEGQGLRKAGLQGCGDGGCRSGLLAERVTVTMPSELVAGIDRIDGRHHRGSLVVAAIDQQAAGVPRFCTVANSRFLLPLSETCCAKLFDRQQAAPAVAFDPGLGQLVPF